MKNKISVENTKEGTVLFFLSFNIAWNHYQDLIRANVPAKIKENGKTMFECSFEDIFGFIS